MIKLILKWLILLALLSYIAIASMWAIDYAEQQTLDDIVINIDKNSPTKFVTKEGVIQKLGKTADKIKHTPIAELNIEKLERQLSQDNSFENVECYITSDNKLQIDIVPMIPEIRVFSPDGKSYYINKDGKRIDTGNEFFMDVPVVTGNFDQKFPAKNILPVTRHIAADDYLKNLITMIEVKSATNILLYPCIKGQVINIGDTTELTKKFDNLTLFYRKVMNHKGWETYDTISVKFRNQIVATRRDKSKKIHSIEVDDSVNIDEQSLQGIDLLDQASTQSQQNNNNNPTTH
ncbi:MAG: hypothetical protein IIV50_03210 [Muribaculaceae bacterium]|nr:hypothetical protein [Muribaculaceae bacterium]